MLSPVTKLDHLAPHPNKQRQSFIVCIWSERTQVGAPVWRGYLETSGGERSYFASPDELDRLFREHGCWVSPDGSNP